MAYAKLSHHQPNLFSAISIGVGCIIGSGWLFASYKAAKFAGPVSVFSWIIGAVIALLIALLLAEIATTYHKETGLFARLLTISHNRDMGFTISSANWFSTIVTIPSEAEASMQYLFKVFPSISDSIFINNHFTGFGTALVCIVMLFYCILNYWGMKLLTKANNIITVVKLIVPALTAVIILFASFHARNFTSYHNTIAPYGYDKMFTAVVTCGIFYSFYGFGMITIFAKELKNPQRNIPLALASSISICLVIYLLLQIAFIGAFDGATIAKNGWSGLDLSSPLAQLAALLGINWLSLVLYADAAVSPSGTGIIYVGSSARMLTGMAEDKQMPMLFAKEHAQHKVSRLSIVTTFLICICLVVFFDNWDEILIMVSVFQLLSCMAVPIAFSKLRKTNKDQISPFKMPYGIICSYIVYIIVSYLLVQCGGLAISVSFICLAILFSIYSSVYYKNVLNILKAFASSWSIFVYIVIAIAFGFIQDMQMFHQTYIVVVFIGLITIMYYFLINQNSYNKA